MQDILSFSSTDCNDKAELQVFKVKMRLSTAWQRRWVASMTQGEIAKSPTKSTGPQFNSAVSGAHG